MRLRQLLPVVIFGLAAWVPCAAQEHGTGFIPLPSEDYDAQPHAVRARAAVLLSKVDLTPFMPPVGDQKQMGSCSAWAVSYAMRSYYLAATTGRKPVDHNDIASPTYVFNSTTIRPSPVARDCGGATIKSAIELLVNQGSTSLQRSPYDGQGCMPAPSAADRALAKDLRLPGYAAIEPGYLKTTDAYREHLEHGRPVIVGFRINTDEWFNIHTPGVWTLGPNSLITNGGHAMVVVGYDDNKVAANGDRGAFRLQNSWGDGWGDHGYLWISYNAFKALVQEAYVFKDVTVPMSPRDGKLGPASNLDVNAPATIATTVTKPTAPAVVPVTPPPPPPALVTADIGGELNSLVKSFRTGEARVLKLGNNYQITGYGCGDAVTLLRAQTSKYGSRVVVSMDEVPWPACEIRGLLKDVVGKAGVAASVTNLEPDAPPVVRGVQITEEGKPLSTTAILRDGDAFEIDTEVQDRAPFVQIFYLQADHSAKEIWRGEIKPDRQGRRRLSIGGATSKIKLTASRPFGAEAVLIVAGKAAVSPRTLDPNTSEVDFMDRLRSDLGAAIAGNPNIRAALVQVEVRPSVGQIQDTDTGPVSPQAPIAGPVPAPVAAHWLITPDEKESFGEAGATGYAPPLWAYSDIGGPQIRVVSPNVMGGMSGPMTIQLQFVPGQGGQAVVPSSLTVGYKGEDGYHYVTDSALQGATVSSTGLVTLPLSLPDGQHRLRITVEDGLHRRGFAELNFKTGG